MSDQVQTHKPTTFSSSSSHQNCHQHLYEERLSLSVCLTMGRKYLSKEQFAEANDAFDSAHRFLTTAPSVALSGNLIDQELLKKNATVSTLSSSTTESIPMSHIDTYHEDECDVGPRLFNAPIVPEDVMGLDVDVLQLMIAYNQALVYQASKNNALASQLFKFITGTIGTYLSSGSVDATLTHLAMRAHNNLGQIEYKERSEEHGLCEFEKALMYARHHFHLSQAAGSNPLRPSTHAVQINPVTTPPEHQLEIATVLSNWCRSRWMMGRMDENVCEALNDILQIRSANLDANHPDVATSHFNLGRVEYSRQAKEKALKHLLKYMQIASQTFQDKNTDGNISATDKDRNSRIELDPIQGLIYVLQIQNEGKDDEVSTDLVWGLRTLQDKRQDLGPIHSDVASVLNYIGTLLFRRRELDYALCFFAQELKVEETLKSQFGTQKSNDANEDVSISVTCNNIGRILQELGRYSEAKFYYQRSLGDENIFVSRSSQKQKFEPGSKASDDTFMDDSDDISDIPAAAMNLYSTVWYNLGLIHDKLGAFKEAIRSFRMSLKLRRAMLGHEHSDVSCLYYNIGVLQMEQKLLNDATESFRQALAYRHVSGKGQLNDVHVIKTLQKLSLMHKAKGNVRGAIEANKDILSVLSSSHDFEHRIRKIKMAIVMRDIADLYQAQGDLNVALKHAMDSVDLFREIRTSTGDDIISMEIDDTSENERSYIEEEASSLHLVGSLRHELCESLDAQKAFSETARLVHSSLATSVANSTTTSKLAAALLPLLEVSTILSTPSCAPEA